jgi:hypothetical protein
MKLPASHIQILVLPVCLAGRKRGFISALSAHRSVARSPCGCIDFCIASKTDGTGGEPTDQTWGSGGKTI